MESQRSFEIWNTQHLKSEQKMTIWNTKIELHRKVRKREKVKAAIHPYICRMTITYTSLNFCKPFACSTHYFDLKVTSRSTRQTRRWRLNHWTNTQSSSSSILMEREKYFTFIHRSAIVNCNFSQKVFGLRMRWNTFFFWTIPEIHLHCLKSYEWSD